MKTLLRNLSPLLFLTVVFLPRIACADLVDHSGNNGSFTDNMWFDQTTGMHNVNPGPNDDAEFYASTITVGTGSAHLVTGSALVVSGTFTAVNAGVLDLSGAGTLHLQTILQDPNGFGPVLSVTGGHLTTQNGDGVTDVTAGGTVIDAVCSGSNGCGAYSGSDSSLTITGLGGPDHASFASKSKLTANAGLTGFTLQISSGATAVVGSMTTSQATVDGAGSLLTVGGKVSLNSASMNITNGGAAVVGGDLTQLEGAPLYVTGAGSSLTVGGELSHNTASDTDVFINSGATTRVSGDLTQVRGQVEVDDANSALTVDKDLVDSAGFLNITAGAALTVSGQLVLDGGFDLDGDAISGAGNWKDAGTTISSSGALFVGNTSTAGFSLFVSNKAAVKSGNVTIAAAAGSVGSVDLTDLGTIWEVQSSGVSIGQEGTGTVTMENGAHLTFDAGTAFAIGFDAGSHGSLTCDTASVDATAALVSIGEGKGSVGVVNLTDSSFSVGHDFTVGDSGSGNLVFSGSSAVAVTSSTTNFLVGNEAGSIGSVSGNGSLTVEGPMTVGVSGSGFLGSDGGVLSLTNAAGLVVASQANSSGSVVLGPSSDLTLAGPLVLGDAGAATFELDSNAALDLPALGAPNLILGRKKGGTGTMTVTSVGSLNDAEPITIGDAGHGVFTAEVSSNIQTSVITAPFSDGGQATITVDNSDWVNSLNLYLGSQAAGDPPSTLLVTDGATMRVGDRMTIFNSGTVTISDDSRMAVGSGDFGANGSLRVSTGGILSGFGRVQGQVIVAAGGQIFPGNSTGVLNITGTYKQEAGSTYSAEIGGTTAGSGFDQVNATGAATLGGTLKVRLVQGFTPTVGQTFRLVKSVSTAGSFGVISQPSQAGISVGSDSTGVVVTVTSVVAGAPVISSATTATAAPGEPFTYQISASHAPTSYGATDLPAGLTVNHTTGVISGTPTTAGAFVVPINANNAAGSGQADLIISVDSSFSLAALPASNLLNISTRLDVKTDDDVLIAGFIVTGTDAKKVLLRGLGPSLADAGVTGVLPDPVLELHKPDGSVVTNDNWQDTQEAAIVATDIPPTRPLESAIVATLDPGTYTVILHGQGSATGVGLVEVYDLDQAALSQLANISTRGFVGTGDNVLIGGFIVGGGGEGFASVTVRGLGPSLTGAGVAGALLNPTLEVHNAQGDLLDANDNWMDGPDRQALIDEQLAPTKNNESALIAKLAPGNYTAIVRGVNNTTGVALVEAYNVQ